MASILGGDEGWDRAAALRDERCCTECGSRTITVGCFIGDERHDMHRVCGYCCGVIATQRAVFRAQLAEARGLLEALAEMHPDGNPAPHIDRARAWLAANRGKW